MCKHLRRRRRRRRLLLRTCLLLLAPLFLAPPPGLTAQTVDNSTLEVQADSLTGTYRLTTTALFDDGSASTYTSPYYDSLTLVEYLADIRLNGGRIGAVPFLGESNLTSAYRTVTLANQHNRQTRLLEDAWAVITARDFAQNNTGADQELEGDFILYTPEPLLAEVPLTIARTPQRLRLVSSLIGNGRVDVADADRITLAGTQLAVGKLTLIRARPGGRFFFSLDRTYRLVQTRN